MPEREFMPTVLSDDAAQKTQFLDYAWRHLSGKERAVALVLCLHFQVTGIQGFYRAAEGMRKFVTELHTSPVFLRAPLDHYDTQTLQRRIYELGQYVSRAYNTLNREGAPHGLRGGGFSGEEEHLWRWFLGQTDAGKVDVLQSIITAWPILKHFNRMDEEHYLAILTLCGQNYSSPRQDTTKTIIRGALFEFQSKCDEAKQNAARLGLSKLSD